MIRLTVGAIALALMVMGALVGAQAPAAGGGQGGARQGGGPPPLPPTNLQVLPKDWTRPQVVAVMQQFNQALGVTCNHCHVFNGPGDPMNDFATDMKPQKNMARAMMRMTAALQPQVQQAVNKPAESATRVSCAMCHRGAATPVVPPPPAPAAAAGAAPAGAPPAGAGRGN
jgi:hypothetical protein